MEVEHEQAAALVLDAEDRHGAAARRRLFGVRHGIDHPGLEGEVGAGPGRPVARGRERPLNQGEDGVRALGAQAVGSGAVLRRCRDEDHANLETAGLEQP